MFWAWHIEKIYYIHGNWDCDFWTICYHHCSSIILGSLAVISGDMLEWVCYKVGWFWWNNDHLTPNECACQSQFWVQGCVWVRNFSTKSQFHMGNKNYNNCQLMFYTFVLTKEWVCCRDNDNKVLKRNHKICKKDQV